LQQGEVLRLVFEIDSNKGIRMNSVKGHTSQQLVEISALVSNRLYGEADEKLAAVIRSTSPEALVLVSPDIRALILKFMHKRQRDLTLLLEQKLNRARSPQLLTVSETTRRVVRAPAYAHTDRLSHYIQRLTELRDRHIFQWNTFYRQNIGFIYSDLLNSSPDKENLAEHLESVGQAFADHAAEIFSRGYSRLESQGISSEVGVIKSINGLQRFAYLLVELLLAERISVNTSKDARRAWSTASSLIVGVLRGYGRTKFGVDSGWALLARNIQAWLPVLGYARGTDVLNLFDEFDDSCSVENLYLTIAPCQLAIEQLANKYHQADFLFPRFSRIAQGYPARFSVTLDSRRSGISRDLICTCFFSEESTQTRPLHEALSLGAAVVLARLSPHVKAELDAHSPMPIIDASEAKSDAAHAQNLAELILAALESQANADAAQRDPEAIERNYARDFPLEDPEFRRLFMVERHSVRKLLETFENSNGIHLWCSVRRSGKTTAATNLVERTEGSVVVLQTMDHQPNQPEQNVLERRVREALSSEKAIPPDFFSQVVNECVLSSLPIDAKPRKIVLIIDEYESLFGLLTAFYERTPGLRFLVVLPLLSQMVAFSAKNLIIFMGQRPDAHFVFSAQSQLGPLVRQHNFPLFEHFPGSQGSEFMQFLRRVMSEKIDLDASFGDAVYVETGGHPYLTVNLMVDFFEWMIENRAKEGQGSLQGTQFEEFSRHRLTQAALKRSSQYAFFHRMLGEYLSESARSKEPWLYAIARILDQIAIKHPKTFSCSIATFQQLATPIGSSVGMAPDRLLAEATMANFLRDQKGQVSSGIRLLSRLAASTSPAVN
jgi:hypothetical protein